MADYQMAFILTDSEMKKSSADSDEKEIVKRENLTPDMMAQYVPLMGRRWSEKKTILAVFINTSKVTKTPLLAVVAQWLAY